MTNIPDYQAFMLPMLKLAADQEEHASRDAIDALAQKFGLTEEQRSELLPSGRQPIVDNRIGWARTYLKKAGLLEYPRRASFKITERGLSVLRQKPSKIDLDFLMQFPEFVAFRTLKHEKKNAVAEDELAVTDAQTPEEQIEAAHQKLRNSLADDLLERLKQCAPQFFERVVIDLLLAMGYGGTRRDAGQAIGRTGDGGIDGIIKEDRLGLDIIYVQAKRWEGTVGRPEIQKFAGALQGQRAKKGVFITTSSFTQEASTYAGMIDTRIVLIDGTLLAKLMFDHNVGVALGSVYEVKRIDLDYFETD